MLDIYVSGTVEICHSNQSKDTRKKILLLVADMPPTQTLRGFILSFERDPSTSPCDKFSGLQKYSITTHMSTN